MDILFKCTNIRYWNDKEALEKLGEAMGLPAPRDASSFAGYSGADEVGVSEEDETLVHHTASVGDVEVLNYKPPFPDMFKVQRIYYKDRKWVIMQ